MRIETTILYGVDWGEDGGIEMWDDPVNTFDEYNNPLTLSAEKYAREIADNEEQVKAIRVTKVIEYI